MTEILDLAAWREERPQLDLSVLEGLEPEVDDDGLVTFHPVGEVE